MEENPGAHRKLGEGIVSYIKKWKVIEFDNLVQHRISKALKTWNPDQHKSDFKEVSEKETLFQVSGNHTWNEIMTIQLKQSGLTG